MLVILLVTGMITARAQSSYTTIQFKDNMKSALALELPYTTDEVEGTILEKLKQSGFKPDTRGSFFWKRNKTDGFYVFNEVMLPSAGTQKLDLYFKVVQKNNEEKNNSILYLMASNGNENFLSPDGDTILWNSTMAFLNSFKDKTTAFSLEQSIINQESGIKDSQEKLASLQKEGKDLDEKLRKNQDEQKNRQLELDNQIKMLENLKLKRKT